jgi:hypothetical protein
MGVLIGVAVGHRRHPTALAVVEDERRKEGRHRSWDHYLVRHLERLPAGTPYPAAAERLAEIVAILEQRGTRSPRAYVDATGSGEPLVELIGNVVRRCRVLGVYFTHGDRRSEDGNVIQLGKAYLVTQLKILLQTGQLHLPRTREAETLAQDLIEYEVEVSEDANDRYGAFRVGRHDDLITALGLAVHKRRSVSIYPGDRSGSTR